MSPLFPGFGAYGYGRLLTNPSGGTIRVSFSYSSDAFLVLILCPQIIVEIGLLSYQVNFKYLELCI